MKYKEVRIQVALMFLLLLHIINTVVHGDEKMLITQWANERSNHQFEIFEDNFSIKADGVFVSDFQKKSIFNHQVSVNKEIPNPLNKYILTANNSLTVVPMNLLEMPLVEEFY